MYLFLRIFFFSFFLTYQLQAVDFAEEGEIVLGNQPQFVSLGGTCHMALALRANGLRKAAFPFDWFISTDHNTFIKVLDEDFRFFTDENYFVRFDGIPASVNQYYGIGFPHDFDLVNFTNGREQWNTFKKRYDRRINRFRSLRNYPGKVYFVRAYWSSLLEGQNGEFNENSKKAQELRAALDRYFPSLNFTLIVVSYQDLNIPKIQNVPGVVEFQIGRSHQEFQEAANKLLASDSRFQQRFYSTSSSSSTAD